MRMPGAMMMLREFTARKFRNISVEAMKLEPLNLLVGPNNSGKSNLIDAMSLFANLVNTDSKDGGFHDYLMRRGWSDVLDRYVDAPAEISLKWELDGATGFPDLVYELNFMIGSNTDIPHGFYITSEVLRNSQPVDDQHEKAFEYFCCHSKAPGKGLFFVKQMGKRQVKRVQLDVEPKDSVFRQVEGLLENQKFRMDFYPSFINAVNSLRKYLEGFASYASTRLDPARIRQPVAIDVTARHLNESGSNFANVLDYLNRNYPDFLDDYTTHIRRLIPGLDKLRVMHVTDTALQVELIINSKKFKLHEMSDGTVRALVIALLLHTPERMSLLAIDEPELNIHPAWLRIISEWIVLCQSADQLVISTHSPDLLDGFTEKFQSGGLGLLVTQMDGTDTVRRVYPGELREKFHEGWELGDLYRVGDTTLGGWPW